MRWFTSDLHLFHKLIHRKYRSHNSDIIAMNNEIIKQWNKQVKSRDVVYILGDVTFGKYEETKEIISKLNGDKILIRGNHDERFTSKEWVEMGFKDVRDTMVFKKDDEKWILSHYPYSSSFKFFYHKWFSKRSEAGYYKLYLPWKGYKLIHGHHHSGPSITPSAVNVAWDVNGKLLSENDIRGMFKKTSLLEKVKLVFW